MGSSLLLLARVDQGVFWGSVVLDCSECLLFPREKYPQNGVLVCSNNSVGRSRERRQNISLICILQDAFPDAAVPFGGGAEGGQCE